MLPRTSSTSYSTASTSYPTYLEETTTHSRPVTSRTSNGRPRTRPRTGASTLTGGGKDQQIICAISESRGISSTIGLAFVNLSTTESVLCQIVDNQTYVRTLHKLMVFQPTELLIASTAIQPNKSMLYSIIETNIPDLPITAIDRKYWGETTGVEYIQQLAFKEDVEAIKVAIGGNYFATCCLAAALKYVELSLSISFPLHSMRIKYEPSEGSMMIDLSTIYSMELIQNLQNAKSKDCLFGLLNHTLTPMGSRLLRANILQPLTERDVLERRYDALDELVTKEEMYFATRQGLHAVWSLYPDLGLPVLIGLIALKAFLDVDRTLTNIIIIPMKPSIQHSEQSINNVIMLKQYVKSIQPVFDALANARTPLLSSIRQLCAPAMFADIQTIIDDAINPDIGYQSKPLESRNQRTYAVQSGVNGLLDIARQTYNEANTDAYQDVVELGQAHGLSLELKYDTARQYYIQIKMSQLEDRNLPEVFINSFKRKGMIDCQTLDLVKLNQKIMDSHHEVLQMSDRIIQELIDNIREDVAPLFRISEGIAMLDMIASLAELVTTQEYRRPELTDTLAIRDGRHPIREKIYTEKFIPNDTYATQQSRFQIITGCNMSGKSTYIRSIALMQVMAQIGCFVPASYASFPICRELFARVSMDDSIEANVSTFAAEMREAAFILRNVDRNSLVIIDELGRGTSTRDGLAIAIAIAEALIESRALVWFVTHFRDLAKFLSERSGVNNLHLEVNMSQEDRMMMLYKVSEGYVQEEHYGIAMAKVAVLPQSVIETAEQVSGTITRMNERKNKTSATVLKNRQKRLNFGLVEQLMQQRDGSMQGEQLWAWCRALQKEFVRRTVALQTEARRVEEEEIASEVSGGVEQSDMSTDGERDASEESGIMEQRERSLDRGRSATPESTIMERNLRGRSISTEVSSMAGVSDGRYMMSGALQ